jgi:hypothetical protein
MRRTLSFVALFLCSQAAWALPGGAPAGMPGETNGSPISRDALLAVSAGVNLLGTSLIAVELATGKKPLAASAASLILTAPTAIYLGNQLRKDPGDALLIGATVWTTALVTRTVIDLIIHHDPTTEISNRRTIIQPMFEPGTGGRKPSIGANLSGSF